MLVRIVFWLVPLTLWKFVKHTKAVACSEVKRGACKLATTPKSSALRLARAFISYFFRSLSVILVGLVILLLTVPEVSGSKIKSSFFLVEKTAWDY